MARLSQPGLALVMLGCILLALTCAGVFLQRHDNLPGFIAIALAQGIVYLAAVWIVCRAASKRSLLLAVLVIAELLRAGIVFAPPYLSDDLYRYIWDGRVQAAGINPYRFVPDDEQLRELRDPSIYPHINRRDYAPTIYPPLAESIFFGITRVSETVTWMKLAMVAFEAFAMWLIVKLLSASRLPAERVLIYAWHPLALWEIAGSGHVEAVLIALIALALWCRRRELRALTGIALAGAALVKFFPALLLPAFYRRWDWKMPLAFAATFLLAYAPYAGVGAGAIGFLPCYFREEGLLHGWGIFPLSVIVRLLGLRDASGPAYLVFAAAALAILGLYVVLRNRIAVRIDHSISDALLLALTFSVLLSPHYAWYFLWLVPFLCFRLYLPAFYLTLASFLLYELRLHTSGPVFFRIGLLLWGPFAVLVVVSWFARRAQPREETRVSCPEESRNAACVSR
jgi:alpha-1,6-mannosyltransferase